MSKPDLIRYEQNPDTKFYLCRQCQVHLALHEKFVHKLSSNQHALFKSLVNVNLGPNYTMSMGQTAAQAFCTNCDSELGAKFIALRFQTSAIVPGAFMIDLKKLLFWNGNQILYGDTEEPVPNA